MANDMTPAAKYQDLSDNTLADLVSRHDISRTDGLTRDDLIALVERHDLIGRERQLGAERAARTATPDGRPGRGRRSHPLGEVTHAGDGFTEYEDTTFGGGRVQIWDES